MNLRIPLALGCTLELRSIGDKVFISVADVDRFLAKGWVEKDEFVQNIKLLEKSS